MALAGIIFDMDGTLLDTERLALRAWQATEVSTGVRFPDGFIHSIVGANTKTAHALAATALGSVDRAEDFFDRYRAAYHAHIVGEGVPIKRGARSILRWGRRQGLRLALATSTRRSVATLKLEQSGFAPFFEVVVCGDEIENGKPAPDIFTRACVELGLAPEAVVAIEDSPNGVRSSVAAGIRTILIPDLAPVDDAVRALAWKVGSDLHDARGWIEAEIAT